MAKKLNEAAVVRKRSAALRNYTKSVPPDAKSVTFSAIMEHGKCVGTRIVYVLNGARVLKDLRDKPKEELWGADPNCNHKIVTARGGGVKCTKCQGWFCY